MAAATYSSPVTVHSRGSLSMRDKKRFISTGAKGIPMGAAMGGTLSISTG